MDTLPRVLSSAYQVTRVFHGNISVCRSHKTGRQIVVKPETRETLYMALVGYAAAYMAGQLSQIAPLLVRGTEPPGSPADSDWKPHGITGGVLLFPACKSRRLTLVPNILKLEFEHKTLEHTWVPPFVRPDVVARGDLHTITPYGICGVEMIAASPVAKRSLQTIAETVAALAERKLFCTDLKIGNFVYLYDTGWPEGVVDSAVLIDTDQIAVTGRRRSHSASFFNELWWLAEAHPDIFDVALWHPDIEAVCRQAQSTLTRTKSGGYKARLEMHLLMRAILALMNFQLNGDLEIPDGLLAPKASEVTWSCCVGTSFFDSYVMP